LRVLPTQNCLSATWAQGLKENFFLTECVNTGTVIRISAAALPQ
jgi:hypothetical protein